MSIMKGGFLSGKKTYITAILGIATAVGLYLTGEADLTITIQSIFTLASAAFIRHGIAGK